MNNKEMDKMLEAYGSTTNYCYDLWRGRHGQDHAGSYVPEACIHPH